ncbi:SGNH/GDSL hydrolase family protein [Adhaeribacter radiodurans]|uniref:SGNH/GDSL hydrolase family protein n=1 Tax=Adhaeribacter radiodurans TaxID=2745197 RepID=A0A7L7L290_9BACT|nr:GDSL-type esterase/lipase family protein [Adhaeribacter radiodurans]QMU26916.1 SGNH/GDSL hydrolase family protein [Adhaeribacter radiodurans]
MRILFIGDSITRGKLGVSYIQLIKKEFPAYELVNLGVDGDTFSNISRRLQTKIEQDSEFDYIVLQGGYNDIFLPYFREKSKLFQFALKQQLKKGLVPLETAPAFEAELRKIVKTVKQKFRGKLVVTTIGCINEFRGFVLNSKRKEYNTIIRHVAQEENIGLADCGLLFDQVLQQELQTNYFLESFWTVTVADRIISVFKNGPDWLSQKRKLKLTIDGVHLNKKGAALVKKSLLPNLSLPERKAKLVV